MIMNARVSALILVLLSLTACASLPPHVASVEHERYLVTAQAARLAATSFEVNVIVDELSLNGPPTRIYASTITLTAGSDTASGSESQHDSSAVYATVQVEEQGNGALATLRVRVVRPDGGETHVPPIVLGVGKW
jgi:hypothetical protein